MDPATSPLQPPDPPDRDTPPILTIHGDADSIVLYDHATRLHELLDEWGVPNHLITIADGGPGTIAFAPSSARRSRLILLRFSSRRGTRLSLPQAVKLRRLGYPDNLIAACTGVTDKTVAKAIRWFESR